MPSENIVIFAGHLGKDAETAFTPSNIQYTKFSMCQTKKWKQGDNWKEKQIWANVIAWRNDYATNLKKGAGVAIIGELDYNVWTDKNQSKRFDLSIIAKSVLPIQKIEKPNNETKKENTSDPGEPSPPSEDEGDGLPF